MKNLLISLSLSAFLFCVYKPIKAQNDLQCRVNILEIGKSTFNEVKMLFGNLDSRKKISSWRNNSSNSSGLKKWYRFIDSEQTDLETNFIINLYEFEDKEKGLVFNLFDNPDELYSVEITNAKIPVLGIKVGDKLSKIISKFGRNDEWTSNNGSDYWTLTYEKLNIKFVFLRDKNYKQFPMKLDKKKVIVRIEK